MGEIFICGMGAVSPAGWGVEALRLALRQDNPITPKELTRPGWPHTMRARVVPPPAPRPTFVNHARLRRTSLIAQHAVGAALEAVGEKPAAANGAQLGIIMCVMSGCVNYSRRFYDETLKDPSTASPLVFPETVFNAPASHIAALLETAAINYTLVGDAGTFLQGIALAADWLLTDRVSGCLVIGAEELDWLTTEAFRLFDLRTIVSDGAGALYLRRERGSSCAGRLGAISQPYLFTRNQTRAQAARLARLELQSPDANELLCDGLQGSHRLDNDEARAWSDWAGPRLSPKRILGEGSAAAAAWQCIAAIDALQRGHHPAATVSIVGCNQQAIAARFLSVG
jgi:3-oxoacyl-(acyl-carrier-protein) synthase